MDAYGFKRILKFMVPIYRPNAELKNHYIELAPEKITLQLMDSNGNIIYQNLKPQGKVFNADESIESGKVNLTKFRVKKKEDAAGAFIQIFGFNLSLGELGRKEFKLKKPLRYYLPNNNNVSPLVDSASIILTGGYSKLYLMDGKVKLHIPVAEKRIFQAKKDLDRY
jgi:hypothetical protein